MNGRVIARHLERGGLAVLAVRGEEVLIAQQDGRGKRRRFWRADTAGRWKRIDHLDAVAFTFDAEQRAESWQSV